MSEEQKVNDENADNRLSIYGRISKNVKEINIKKSVITLVVGVTFGFGVAGLYYYLKGDLSE